MAEIYKKGQNPQIDAEFENTEAFGKLRLGGTHLFWKQTLRWNMLDFSAVSRAYTKEGDSEGCTCACCNSYKVSTLILEMEDGETEEVTIGAELKGTEAEDLLNAIKTACPSIELGRSEEDTLWDL